MKNAMFIKNTKIQVHFLAVGSCRGSRYKTEVMVLSPTLSSKTQISCAVGRLSVHS